MATAQASALAELTTSVRGVTDTVNKLANTMDEVQADVAKIRTTLAVNEDAMASIKGANGGPSLEQRLSLQVQNGLEKQRQYVDERDEHKNNNIKQQLMLEKELAKTEIEAMKTQQRHAEEMAAVNAKTAAMALEAAEARAKAEAASIKLIALEANERIKEHIRDFQGYEARMKTETDARVEKYDEKLAELKGLVKWGQGALWAAGGLLALAMKLLLH